MLRSSIRARRSWTSPVPPTRSWPGTAASPRHRGRGRRSRDSGPSSPVSRRPARTITCPGRARSPRCRTAPSSARGTAPCGSTASSRPASRCGPSPNSSAAGPTRRSTSTTTHGTETTMGERTHRRRSGATRRAGAGRAAGATRRSARDVALAVLTEVDESDAYANLLLPARLREARLDPRDASLATELTYGTLRGLGLYDAVAQAAADRHPADLDARTASAVRMGVHQLLRTRVADHAAVSETVDALRRAGGGGAGGLVNAVLRRVSAHDADAWIEQLTADRGADEALALSTSHPTWIVRALRIALRGHGRGGAGRGASLRGVLEADNAPAKVSLAALPGLADRDALAAADDPPLRRTDLSPIGLELAAGDPRDVPGVAEAHVRVQDQGSQLVALALAQADDAPRPAWLDL